MAFRTRSRGAPSRGRAGRRRSDEEFASSTDTGEAAAPLVLTNVPDATLRKHLRECHRRKTEVDRVTGDYRNAIKAAKADGIEPADVAWFIRSKKRDAADIDAELRRRARIAAVLELETMLKPSLFPDFEAPAAPAKGAAKPARSFPAGSRKALIQAAAQGHTAGSTGISKEACPYPGGTPEAVKWFAGWAEAQTGIVSKMGGEANGEDARA